MAERIQIRSRDGGSFGGYLAPPATGRGPGVVVIQEIFGVNAYLRGVADGLAARGFTALCPDLFWRQQPGVELTDRTEEEWQQARAFMRGMDEAKAMEDLASALDQLRSHPACDGRAGAVGFCMGGRLAFRLALSGAADCCIGYYGVGIEKLLDPDRGPRAPLMLHMPGRDNACPPPAQAAIHAALDGHPLATLHDYPAQDHAFARAGGRNYDAAAADLAHRRTIDFLARHLQGAAR